MTLFIDIQNYLFDFRPPSQPSPNGDGVRSFSPLGPVCRSGSAGRETGKGVKEIIKKLIDLQDY